MIEAMARIAPSQPIWTFEFNFFGLDSKLFSEVQIYSKRGSGLADPETWDRTTTTTTTTTAQSPNPTILRSA
jgi:hypothetical protein